MKAHKIHSVRFGANQQKVSIYTSCGRVQVTVDDDITKGIKIAFKPHKTKRIVRGSVFQNESCLDMDTCTYLSPKRRYKQVRTTRQGSTK